MWELRSGAQLKQSCSPSKRTCIHSFIEQTPVFAGGESGNKVREVDWSQIIYRAVQAVLGFWI